MGGSKWLAQCHLSHPLASARGRLITTTAACPAARCPLASLPSRDGLVPGVAAVWLQPDRIRLAGFEAVGEHRRTPDPVLLVHPPPRPLGRGIPARRIDRRLCPDPGDDPSRGEVIRVKGPGTLLGLDPARGGCL